MSGSANHSVVMLGLPESPFENFILYNINITAFDGLRAENTKNFHIVNFTQFFGTIIFFKYFN
jgi:hypothetical protein